MKLGFVTRCLTAVFAVVFLNGCLVRETVTSGGEVLSENYVVKRPLKDAIERSE